jgi:hypothetical protein
VNFVKKRLLLKAVPSQTFRQSDAGKLVPLHLNLSGMSGIIDESL